MGLKRRLLSRYRKLSGTPVAEEFTRTSTVYSIGVKLPDCYMVENKCPPCAKNHGFMMNNRKEIQLFCAAAPLGFMAIYLIGELIQNKRGISILRVITDRFGKLKRTVPLKSIKEKTLDKAFITHWVIDSGTPH